MSIFKNLTTQGLEKAEDRIGGGGVLESGIYSGKIKAAYAGQSNSGANNVTLIVDIGGREYRETIYVTNRAGENFFLNKNDPTKKVPLPGFTLMDQICMLTTEQPLSEQEAEEKVIKIYDFEQKAELPTAVPMLTALIGQPISLAILKEIVNKNEKNSAGDYVPTAEVREQNVIDKAFHTETKLTLLEAERGETQGSFWDAWEEKNKGKPRDKRTIKEGTGVVSGRPSKQPTPPTPASSTTPRKSLFGKKD